MYTNKQSPFTLRMKKKCNGHNKETRYDPKSCMCYTFNPASSHVSHPKDPSKCSYEYITVIPESGGGVEGDS